MRRPRVSLGSALIVIAALALCLAPIRVAPGFSVLLAVVLVPTTARAIWTIEGRRGDGRPMTAMKAIEFGLGSFVLVVLLGLTAAGAFLGTCFSIGMVAVQIPD